MSGSESEKDWASSDGEEKEQPMATGLPSVTPEPRPVGRGMRMVMPKYMLQKAQQKESRQVAWTGAGSCRIWVYRTCVLFFVRIRETEDPALDSNVPPWESPRRPAQSSMRACLCSLWGRVMFCRSSLTHEAIWFGGWMWLADYSRKLTSAN